MRKNFGARRLFEVRVMYGATRVIIRPSQGVERAVWWMGTDGRLTKGPPRLELWAKSLQSVSWAIG